MRCSSESEIACSNVCASSCTSSHGILKTSHRNASIRRWRETTLCATSRPWGVKCRRFFSSRSIRPSSTSRRTISVTLGWETPMARARFTWVGSIRASSNQ